MIEELREKVSRGEYEFSQHALDASILRRIAVAEIRQVILAGEVIEDHPQDKYGPSCLIYGRTEQGRPLHVQCSHPTRPLVRIITTYEPDPELWIDHRIRRPR